MGIFDALTTAVAGLQAQSFALQNISGNIANSQTTGYKETDTSFQDLVSRPRSQPADRRTASSPVRSATNTVQGTIQSTSVSTDMAINGDGFFVVSQPTGLHRQSAGVLRRQRLHARRRLSAEHQRLSGQRRRLLPDGHSGRSDHRQSRSAASPQVLQFDNNFVPAQETTSIQYQANLPSTPTSGNARSKPISRPIRSDRRSRQIIGTGATLVAGCGGGRHRHGSSLTDATTLHRSA